MNCKTLTLKYMNTDKLMTEIRFHIASARAEGYELVRFDIEADGDTVSDKFTLAVTRKLKLLKTEGKIQFFATDKSFAAGSTEANFLINKYPNIRRDGAPLSDDTKRAVYVKM